MLLVQPSRAELLTSRTATPAAARRARRAAKIILHRGRSVAICHCPDHVVIAGFIGYTLHIASYAPSRLR